MYSKTISVEKQSSILITEGILTRIEFVEDSKDINSRVGSDYQWFFNSFRQLTLQRISKEPHKLSNDTSMSD